MMQGKTRTEAARIAYPDALKQAEAELLGQCEARKPDGGRPYEPQVGVALSGGGIRSATLCLGVFQALAKQDRLGKIDFLSTVSGGGYFGACLGRLFTRAEVKGVGDVQAILSPTQANPSSQAAGSVALPDLTTVLPVYGTLSYAEAMHPLSQFRASVNPQVVSPVLVEFERTATSGLNTVIASAFLGVAMIEDARAVKIVTDA